VFPERVGRVVLDGVVDPERWANQPSYQVSCSNEIGRITVTEYKRRNGLLNQSQPMKPLMALLQHVLLPDLPDVLSPPRTPILRLFANSLATLSM
jgi:hypothetical protein